MSKLTGNLLDAMEGGEVCLLDSGKDNPGKETGFESCGGCDSYVTDSDYASPMDKNEFSMLDINPCKDDDEDNDGQSDCFSFSWFFSKEKAIKMYFNDRRSIGMLLKDLCKPKSLKTLRYCMQRVQDFASTKKGKSRLLCEGGLTVLAEDKNFYYKYFCGRLQEDPEVTKMRWNIIEQLLFELDRKCIIYEKYWEQFAPELLMVMNNACHRDFTGDVFNIISNICRADKTGSMGAIFWKEKMLQVKVLSIICHRRNTYHRQALELMKYLPPQLVENPDFLAEQLAKTFTADMQAPTIILAAEVLQQFIPCFAVNLVRQRCLSNIIELIDRNCDDQKAQCYMKLLLERVGDFIHADNLTAAVFTMYNSPDHHQMLRRLSADQPVYSKGDIWVHLQIFLDNLRNSSAQEEDEEILPA